MKAEGFYFITDSNLTKKNNIEDAESALEGGAPIIQYRDKDKNLIEFLQEGFELKSLCENKALFLINDNATAALLLDADGVHLGQEDMSLMKARNIFGKDRVIGVTVHNIEEAIEAEKSGADYLGVSPVFETKTKLDAGPAGGLELMKKIKEKVKIPCIGIGGINKENVDSVIKAGADGVCAISATVMQDNVKESVGYFVSKFK